MPMEFSPLFVLDDVVVVNATKARGVVETTLEYRESSSGPISQRIGVRLDGGRGQVTEFSHDDLVPKPGVVTY